MPLLLCLRETTLGIPHEVVLRGAPSIAIVTIWNEELFLLISLPRALGVVLWQRSSVQGHDLVFASTELLAVRVQGDRNNIGRVNLHNQEDCFISAKGRGVLKRASVKAIGATFTSVVTDRVARHLQNAPKGVAELAGVMIGVV